MTPPQDKESGGWWLWGGERGSRQAALRTLRLHNK